MTLHAFVDESVRGRYMLCAVLVPSKRVDEIRKLARRLCMPGQRRWHFVDESDRQRRKILDVIAKQECVRALIYTGRGSLRAGRHVCMAPLVCDLVDRKTNRLVLEGIEGVEVDDRRCIAATLRKAGADLNYTHMRPHEEPGLWLPDAIAWAYGAGGDWRRRVRPTLEVVQEVDAAP